MVVEPLVPSDDQAAEPGRDLREAGRQQGLRPTRGARVAGPDLPVPEVFRLPLEAEERTAGGPAALLGVVPDPRLFLLAVDDQDGGVHVEDEPGRSPRVHGHPMEEPIVQGPKFRESGRRDAEQEATDRRGLGVAREPGEVLEHAVLPEQLRRFDPFESKDDRVQQGEQHLAHAVAVVALHDPEVGRHCALEPNTRQLAMQQVHAPVVHQVLGTKNDT